MKRRNFVQSLSLLPLPMLLAKTSLASQVLSEGSNMLHAGDGPSYLCNPLNIEYKYQFIKTFMSNSVTREAADPSLVMFKGKYYLAPSMTAGLFISDNLVDWHFHSLEGQVQVHDYAPDLRVIGDALYYSASSFTAKCPVYRSRDPLTEPFTEVARTMSYVDPNLFEDDDGRVYLYWGSSNKEPLKAVEVDKKTFLPKGEVTDLFLNQLERVGFERNGEDHVLAKPQGLKERIMALATGEAPYIEAPWMTKYRGKYYLQYAVPGAQYNTYLDGVYTSDSPLGPFELAANNPFSYKPGGFMPGAGHGATMEDRYGNFWHIATMRISIGHMFERRLGLWPAGFDADGELFCNQRFGDWVVPVPQRQFDPWQEPEWMLLSVGKKATASSSVSAKGPENATEENVRSWWRAETGAPGEWLKIDLGRVMDVRAIQINFADDALNEPLPKNAPRGGLPVMKRYIDTRSHPTQWQLQASRDDVDYFMVEDKSAATTDLSHDLVVKKDGVMARYIKLTLNALPFKQPATVSGLRIFGSADIALPKKPANVQVARISDFDMDVAFEAAGALGCNILWGHAENKLYHCYTVYGEQAKTIKALVKEQDYFVRVDAFNEAGIVHGDVVSVARNNANQPIL